MYKDGDNKNRLNVRLHHEFCGIIVLFGKNVLQLALNLESFCLSLLSIGIPGRHNHSQIVVYREKKATSTKIVEEGKGLF